MMKLIVHKLFFAIVIGLFCTKISTAQRYVSQDSVVQLYGVIMSADSLRAISNASIIVVNKGRGTISNSDGVFSIAVLKGDRITFSCIGFKDKTIDIPHNLKENQYSVIQLLVNDTAYLPATIIRSRPSREQFERDFV
ncbi:MAG TPA: carboxypeptidase-like regulatory domain-containing protein, partial [Chitinophagaceae bacterium]|nr:carboxypeptidase-like regulatory domain-containing protein [Chitinophagaceae bacterium]